MKAAADAALAAAHLTPAQRERAIHEAASQVQTAQHSLTSRISAATVLCRVGSAWLALQLANGSVPCAGDCTATGGYRGC